ncbi:hypothetical protein LCGC14_1353610 [marine sediment metagenome]|uniref:Uncharacterized protein n=1 Tax=marine sediment metagenome TaxID=412755 RepID=A0A0F9KA37_9ZZZZ
MNEITYHGRNILEGPQNYFRLTTGVTPSFGFFRMSVVDVDYVLTTQAGVPGALVFSSDQGDVTLYNIYMVKSTSISAYEDMVCNVVLADERILWQYTYGTVDYNTYQTSRLIGTAEFELENLNGASEWTFSELIAAVETILGIGSITFTPPTRNPRNIIGANIPGPCILQQLLIALQSYVTIDLQVADPTYTIYTLGDLEIAGDLTIITANSSYLHKARTLRLNPLVQKGLAVKMAASADPDIAPGRHLTYGSATAAGGSGSHFIPSMYAVFGDEENSAALATIGNEIATEYANSFQNTWRDSLYGGIIPFKSNRAIHEIIWTSNAQGAFTQIKSYRPREELKGAALQDLLFSYHKYLLGTGGTTLRSAKIQAGGVPSNNTGPFTCKLLDSDGNETGSTIDVYPRQHLGTNDFDSGNVHPNYSATKILPIYKDLDGVWYTQNVFEDTIDCACS